MKIEINARGLSQNEIQTAIDFTKQTKDMPYVELVERQREKILELLKLDAEFAGLVFDCIREHHPDLIEKV